MKPPRDTTPCYPCSAGLLAYDWIGSWIKPCLFGAREKPRLEARAPLPTFCLQKVLCQVDGNQHFKSSSGTNLNTFGIVSRNSDDTTWPITIYYRYYLEAIGALSVTLLQTLPGLSSNMHYILLNDCHAPWSSLCHLSPRCPWTTAWVKSHSKDRTTLYQRDES